MGLIKYQDGLLRRGNALANSLDCCCGGTPCECISGAECLPSLGYWRNLRMAISGFPAEIYRTTGVQAWRIFGLDQINGTYYLPYYIHNGSNYEEAEPGSTCGYWGYQDIDFILTYETTNALNVTTSRQLLFRFNTLLMGYGNLFYYPEMTTVPANTMLIPAMTGAIAGIPLGSVKTPRPCFDQTEVVINTIRRSNDPFRKSSNPFEFGDHIFSVSYIPQSPGDIFGNPTPYPAGMYLVGHESYCDLLTKKITYELSAHSEGSHQFSGYSITMEWLFDE